MAEKQEAALVTSHEIQSAKTSTISATILGVLLSLIIKSALDHTFEGINAYGLTSKAWDKLASAPGTYVVEISQLAVFLLTLLRFYVGAYRYGSETTKGQGMLQASVGVAGMFILFTGFYVASLDITSSQTFFIIVAAFHFADLVWFYVAAAVLSVPRRIEVLVGVWKLFDAVTAGGLLVLQLAPRPYGQVLSLALLAVIGLLDIYSFHEFYRGMPNWDQYNRWLRWKLKPVGRETASET